MNYQFTIQFSEEQIKYAAKQFFFRRFRNTFLAIGILLLVAVTFFLQSREINGFVGILLGILLFMVATLFFVYVRLAEKPLARFKKYGGIVSYELSDDSFKSKSGWATAEIKWERFKAIWIFPKAWLLLSRDGGYFTFPIEQISNEIREFLKRKISSLGGLIK
jgi:hypothetical protein